MRQLIFVVDGDDAVCQLARRCLESAGYAVLTFSSNDAIREIERNTPALLLIALMLPDGSGISLCRSVRENPSLAGVPIVFLLTDAAEEHRILVLESGGDDCIVKPFSPRELVARVQAVLRRFSPPASSRGS